SRANPTTKDPDAEDPEWRMNNCLRTLRELGVDSLVTIGGDDTAFSASKVAEAAGGGIRVAHVPKTIDDDLPLPGGMPTFGFETARAVGVELVNNLMTDAMTTKRWFFVLAMGRSAGHLRLGELNIDGVLADLIKQRFKERGRKITVTPKNIGYELRCAPPLPFDIAYTRDLGYGAIDYLRSLYREDRDEIGAMITIEQEQMVPMPSGSFTDQ